MKIEVDSIEDQQRSGASAGSELVEFVAAVWSEVLGLDGVDADADFFALGGHSLLALQVTTRLEEALDRELDVGILFEHPIMRDFVDWLADSEHVRRANPTGASEIMIVDRTGELPLSYSQARLWFGQEQIGETPFYNVPCCYRLRGLLNSSALQCALDEIIARHEALRTTFPANDGRPRQVIMPTAPVELRHIDMRSERDPLASARVWVGNEARLPFDVHAGPLLRGALLQLGADDHVLALYMHHIISDGSSMRVFCEELAALYSAFCSGKPSPLEPLPLQYVDFAAWQTRMLTDDVLAPHLEYWRKQLTSAPVLELPVDRPRALKRPYASGQLRFAINARTVDSLREIALRENATIFIVLLAGLQATLARATGQADVCVGSPIANRNLSAAERLIGFFVNTLVMRTDCSGNPRFDELVRRARSAAVDAYRHQDLPFDVLLDELQPRTPPGVNPLYQVHFQVVPMPLRDIRIGDLDAEFFESSSGATPLDLFVHCFETRDGVEGWVEYAADLFDRATIERLLEQYLGLLDAVAIDPARRVWDVEIGATAAPIPGRNAPEGVDRLERLFARQAAASPEVWAVTSRRGHVTYAQLDARRRKLARRLRALGVRGGERIAVMVTSPEDYIVGLLGAMTAGAVAVVLNAADPIEWQRAFLADADVRVIVASSQLGGGADDTPTVFVDRLDDGIDDLPFDGDVARDATDVAALAVIWPTLGEDGRVVAVSSDHASLAARALEFQEAFPLEPRDRVLHTCEPTSYRIVTELLWPVLAGAHVVVVTSDVGDEELATLLDDEAVTCAHVTPRQLAALLRSAAFRRLPRLRRVICSGDGGSSELAEAFAAQTSATLHFAWGSVTADGIALVSSGPADLQPLFRECMGDAAARVLDREMRPVALGNVGHLVLESARGTIATGELARARPEGAQRLRRIDRVVDVGGQRFPLPGIESVLLRHAAVADAAVVWRQDAPGNHRLVAYVEPKPPGDLTDDFSLAVGRVAEWQAEFDAAPHVPSRSEIERLESVAMFVSARSPRAVLELGCGTGWLAGRLAASTEAYVASDFSESTLDRARSELSARGLEHVAFHHREADDFLLIEPESFDAVIANSVTEYFPDISYLTRVVEGAVTATRTGGVVVFSSVRGLARVGAPAGPDSGSDWKRERRLLVDPGFFRSIATALPRVQGVDVHAGEGGRPFDVVLHIGAPVAPGHAATSADSRAMRTTNDPLAWMAAWTRRDALTSDAMAFLRSRLPTAMMPHATLVVDEIPRTADGNPDVLALPVPDGARPLLPTVFRAASTPTEETVARVIAEVLALDALGIDDDFFVLGGHSLLALQATARLQLLFELELDPGLLFDAPTVAMLAAAIDESVSTESAVAERGSVSP